MYKDVYFEEAFVMEKVYIDKRAVELARYIITTKDTVRGAARKFGVSKSTVHMEVTLRNGWKGENIITNMQDNNSSKCVPEHSHESVQAKRDTESAYISSELHIPESIIIKKVFLAGKNPVVKLRFLIK